nr:HPr family phosphocarrier protein [Tissierella sp.]
MYKEEVVLESETGLHARPASLFVKEAAKYTSDINLIRKEQKYNAKSIMGLLSMGAAQGDTLVIEAEGEDEEAAVKALVEIVKNMK